MNKHLSYLDLIIAIVLLVLTVVKGTTLGDPGIGWHLKNGEAIVANLSIPHVDSYLHSYSELPWISDQWASDCILFLIYSFGGYSLLHLFCALLPLVTFGVIMGKRIFDLSPNSLSAFFILILVFLCSSIQWFCRPVLFSFLLFAILYCWLRDAGPIYKLSSRDKISLHLRIFFIFLLWANLHPGFALSAVLFLSLFVETWSSHRKLSLSNYTEVVLLCTTAFCASLLNPYGINLHFSILSLVSSDYFMTLNNEWLAPTVGEVLFIPFYLAGVFITLALLLIPWRFLRVFDLCSVALLFFMSLQQRRYIPFLAIPLGIFLASSALSIARGQCRIELRKFPLFRIIFRDAVKGGTARKTNLYSTILCSAFLLIFVVCYDKIPFRTEQELEFSDTFPKYSVTYLKSHPDSSALFASPNWGGFLIWELWPKHRVFIDDRNTLNGEQRYRDYFTIRNAEAGWISLLELNNFRFLLLSPTDPLVKQLSELSSWRRVDAGSDDVAVLFERALPN